MAYSEYFNTHETNLNEVCNHSPQYLDSNNVCQTSYYNFTNCSTQHLNSNNTCITSHNNYQNIYVTYGSGQTYVGCSQYSQSYCITSYVNFNNTCITTYNNYSDCNTTHVNAINACNTYTNYTNHINYTNPNSGVPISLNWNNWTADDMNATYIQESIDAIKELRNKIDNLSGIKSQNTFNPSQLSPSTGPVNDNEFNDNNANTPEYVEDIHYETLRNNLNALWNDINGGDSNLPVKNDGDIINKNDFNNMKQKIDDLAELDDSTNYANTFQSTAGATHNHNNYINYSDESGTIHNNYVDNN
jgi:hypothetical protein